jgi:hypothetical protein
MDTQLDLRNTFTSETEFVSLLEKYYHDNASLPNAVIITSDQQQSIIDTQPSFLEDPETGELHENPVKNRKPLPIKTLNVYETGFGAVEVVVE